MSEQTAYQTHQDPNQAQKVFEITIKEPWWGAWKKCGWDKSVWGIGIKKARVDFSLMAGFTHFKVHIDERKADYMVPIQAVQDFATSHGTFFKAKMGVILYVIPETMLEKINV